MRCLIKEFEVLQCTGKYAQQSHTENAEAELHLNLLQRALCEVPSIAAGSRTLIAMLRRAETLLDRRHGSALGPAITVIVQSPPRPWDSLRH